MNTINSLFLEPTVDHRRYVEIRFPRGGTKKIVLYDENEVYKENVPEYELEKYPWYLTDPPNITKFDTYIRPEQYVEKPPGTIGYWTWPYFKCNENVTQAGIEPRSLGLQPSIPGKWIISYSVMFQISQQ